MPIPDIPNRMKLTAKNIVVLIYTMKIKCQKYHLPAVAETIMYPSVQNTYRQQPKDKMQKILSYMKIIIANLQTLEALMTV